MQSRPRRSEPIDDANIAAVAGRAAGGAFVAGSLPIPAETTVPAGAASHDVGIACRSWTMSWMGAAGDNRGTTIVDGGHGPPRREPAGVARRPCHPNPATGPTNRR